MPPPRPPLHRSARAPLRRRRGTSSTYVRGYIACGGVKPCRLPLSGCFAPPASAGSAPTRARTNVDAVITSCCQRTMPASFPTGNGDDFALFSAVADLLPTVLCRHLPPPQQEAPAAGCRAILDVCRGGGAMRGAWAGVDGQAKQLPCRLQ